MNKQYLDKSKYDWANDPRHLKIDRDGTMMIPPTRCFHCGRLVENFPYWAAFCRECHIAMSVSFEGPEYDFSDTNDPKKHLAIREAMIPIDFEIEDAYTRGQKSNFKTAAGMPVVANEKDLVEQAEKERIKRLYDLEN